MCLLAHQVETNLDAVHIGVQELHEDSLFGGEVVVKRAFAYPSCLADLSHAGGVIARF